jgi:hypothetical protein
VEEEDAFVFGERACYNAERMAGFNARIVLSLPLAVTCTSTELSLINMAADAWRNCEGKVKVIGTMCLQSVWTWTRLTNGMDVGEAGGAGCPELVISNLFTTQV